jgi:hypothetical membrane protein
VAYVGAVAPTTADRTALTAGAASWLVAAVGYVALEFVAAVAMPGYSYTEHYISALGVPDWSPYAYLMNAALVLQGALFVMGALLVARAVRARFLGVVFVVFTLVAAGGDFLVAIVHGGSPLWNGGHKWLHVLGAILAIVGGNIAVIVGTRVVGRVLVSRIYRFVGALIGVAGLVIFAVLQNYNYWAIDYVPVGVVERACVYTIMLWQALTGVLLLTARRRAVAEGAG